MDEGLVPAAQRRGVQGGVVAAHGEARVLELEIPAGEEIVEGAAEDGRRRFEAGYGGAGVDVAEGEGEEPVVLGVFDFEVAVWGDARRVGGWVLGKGELFFLAGVWLRGTRRGTGKGSGKEANLQVWLDGTEVYTGDCSFWILLRYEMSVLVDHLSFE